MSVREVVNSFERVDNPLRANISHIADYAGFDMWKEDTGNKGKICIRYCSFGKVEVHDESGVAISQFLRMVMYKTPFTSVKSAKDFIRTYVR